jgi:hypothetical protein
MLTTAFIIKSNPDEYDALLTVLPPGGDSRIFFTLGEGARRGDVWTPVSVERYPAPRRKHRGKPVDFPSLAGLGLAFSERALQALKPLVGDAIEPLPLIYEGPGKFYVINILDVTELLDLDRAVVDRRESGYISTVEKYAFKPGSIDGKHIFKCKECLIDDLVSAEFKALVEAEGLVGARFIPVGD